MAAVLTIWAGQFAVMASPLETAAWTTEDGYYWDYGGLTDSVDDIYAEVTKFQTLGSFLVAGSLHVVIFVFVAYRVRCKRSRSCLL